ncbi:hypothetical protein VTO73DRAFT_6341 [Trametes versicolor]
MSLAAVPTEVVELILIFAAAANSPQTVAAFSQTCRAHKELVYGAPDSHLWREIFLATFDDPRESGGGPGWHDAVAFKRTRPRDVPFDWGAEYRKRVWAALYITRQVESTSLRQEDLEEPADLEEVRRTLPALDALVSVLHTASPCPPSFVFSFIPTPGEDPESRLTVGATYPTFPPLPQAMQRSIASSIPTVGPSYAGNGSAKTLGGRNITWLGQALAHGYPPAVTARFSGKTWEGGVAGQHLGEDEFREMQTAGRLIACTGFIPIPHNAAPPTSPVDGPLPHPPAASYLSEEAQRKRARKLARMRVYNMRYLERERHWGPFLPCEDRKVRPTGAPIDDELLQPILALFRLPGHDDDAEEGAEGDDHDHDHVHNHDHEYDEEDQDEDEDDELQGDDAAGEGTTTPPGAPGAPGRSSEPLRLPSPAQLRPDWAYLAAVRTLVEANLREAFGGADLNGLFSLEGLRPGSAPWDASLYAPATATYNVVDSGKGKGKATDSDTEEVDGWDWAGVAGVWKRCVCWMDYRDLILHNLSGEFDDSRMGEAVRLVGMTLRVERYSPSLVPGYEHLPTIHVVGQSDGASIMGPPRRIHGTVGVIADGSVRWMLFSSVESAEVDEWVSEGVQVGGVGSAMGFLGMWTGAQHERMDPLGPCWAWKVG